MGGPEGWKATGSSTLPSSVLEALPVLNKTEEQRPLRSPTVVHSQSISSLLRVRAVVWKRGALQPGGPPLRATTAMHPAAVRRVWILNGNVCRLHGYHRSQLLCIEPEWEATGSPGSSKHINRLGRRQAHPVGGRQGPVRKA